MVDLEYIHMDEEIQSSRDYSKKHTISFSSVPEGFHFSVKRRPINEEE